MNKIYILLLLISLGCNASKDEQQSNTANADYDNGIMLRLNAPENKLFKYAITNTTKTDFTVNTEEIATENTVDMELHYTFKKDTGGLQQLGILFKSLKMKNKQNEEEKELDADIAVGSLDPTERIFSVFKNAKLSALVDSAGIALKINGYDSLEQQMYTIANGNANVLATINNSIKQNVGEAFFKQAIEQNFKLPTTKRLKIGDTLQNNFKITKEINLNVSAIQKLESISNGLATFSSNAEIEIDDQPITMEGQQLIANLQIVQEGKTIINIVTGLPTAITNKLSIKGKLKTLQATVPIKLVLNSAIQQL
jgi:Family of unknown function (DUF6263)